MLHETTHVTEDVAAFHCEAHLLFKGLKQMFFHIIAIHLQATPLSHKLRTEKHTLSGTPSDAHQCCMKQNAARPALQSN